MALTKAQRRAVRQALTGYCFLLPTLAFFAVFFLIPVIMSIHISFHDWNMLVPLANARYVGLKNYSYLLQDEMFGLAFKNTLIWAVGTVALGLVFSLGLALLLLKVKAQGLWRLIMYAPVVTSSAAIARIWLLGVYNPSGGIANSLLGLLGLPPVAWLANGDIALYSIMFVGIWSGVGATMIVFTAGLKGIPDDYYDAARIDGAGRWNEFRHITLPLLRPTILFLTVTGLIAAWQVFDLPYLMAIGQQSSYTPYRSVVTLTIYLYQTAFQNLRMGRATAGAFILFLIVLSVSSVILKVLRKGGVESYE